MKRGDIVKIVIAGSILAFMILVAAFHDVYRSGYRQGAIDAKVGRTLVVEKRVNPPDREYDVFKYGEKQ